MKNSRMANKKKKGDVTNPDLYSYHDYRKFLRDWLAHKKQAERGFSLRRVVQEAKIALGYIPTVISGTRTLTPKALSKLARPLGLTVPERDYLGLLVTVADSNSQEARLEALERIQRSRAYRKLNPKEFEVYRYLTKWHYVAIREMAGLNGFRADPVWIRKRLRGKVSLSEIEEAVTFLKENGYIEILPDGSARFSEKDVECVGGVYRIALSQFHKEMLFMASDALNEIPITERTVMGHTLSISSEYYDEMQKILNDALDRIADLEKKDKPKNVTYQVTVAAFPLSRKEREEP